jgi:hypothetical protein
MTRKNQPKIGGLFDPRYSLSENDPVIDIAVSMNHILLLNIFLRNILAVE